VNLRRGIGLRTHGEQLGRVSVKYASACLCSLWPRSQADSQPLAEIRNRSKKGEKLPPHRLQNFSLRNTRV